jgi:hypothetical protein
MLTTRHPVDFPYSRWELSALGYIKHGDVPREGRIS